MNTQVIKRVDLQYHGMAYCSKLSNYTIAVTTITTIPNGMKVKFLESISKNLYCIDDNLTSMSRLSKGRISNILEKFQV